MKSQVTALLILLSSLTLFSLGIPPRARAELPAPLALPAPPALPGLTCEPSAGPNAAIACVGRIDEYPGALAILIPPGYAAPAGDAPLVMYFHGNNPQNNDIHYYLDRYKLREAAAAGGRILIFPHSLGTVTDQYASHIQVSARFQAFTARVLTLLFGAGLIPGPRAGALTLAGHSGAYRALGAILANGDYRDQINEVYLLDSTYAHEKDFAAFARAPGHRLWSAYSVDGGTIRTSACIMSLLDAPTVDDPAADPAAAPGSEYLLATAHYGCNPFLNACGTNPAPNPACVAPLDGAVSAADLAANRVGFFQTKEEHNDVAMKYLPFFLRR